MTEERYDLTYKTRGESSPQGKPRVYFCAHPKDHARFFEAISDEILARQNCAVWSAKETDAPRDADFLHDLTQMQLFVMPVTAELLCTPNQAIDVEFPFAVRHHIPVLPLMQEEGLEEIFNRKCGDLQFLDKNRHDPTAISYDEKFRNYLSAVLIGDREAERIRAAFDAYIFLSYRKKDRKHARELMRLIHQNEFCRDIAIWYDEFLTPGEDFNDAIRGALNKSALFVLAVTPNLVNEKNYVMTVEYPMAQKAHKHILPAEMVETDRAALAAQYENIPTPTDAHDGEAMRERLSSAVEKLDIQGNNNSPEHHFLIGLAYLGGVDVEVDHDRAVTLITSAAEAGVIEAIDRLVQMYEKGEGVARSYETALTWREKKILCDEARYRERGDDRTLAELLETVIACGDAYMELYRYPSAREKYAQAQAQIEASGRAAENDDIRYGLSLSYEKMGMVCEACGDLAGAREYYEKSLNIREELGPVTGRARDGHALACNYIRLGNVCEAAGNLQAAKQYDIKGYMLLRAMAEQSRDPALRNDLSVCYEKLGDISKACGELSEAKEFYAQAMAVSEELAEEFGTPELRRSLAVGYEHLGTVSLSLGDVASASDYYGKFRDMAEQLAEEVGTAESRYDLSVSYERLGALERQIGNIPAAKRCFEMSLAISEQMAEEIATVKNRRRVSVSYNELGDICRACNDHAGSKRYYEKALAIREELVQETDMPETLHDLASAYNRVGNACLACGEAEAAEAHYEKSREIAERLSEGSGTVEMRRSLALCYTRLGTVKEARGDHTAAKAYYEKALALRTALAEETSDPEDRVNLSATYNDLSNVHQAVKEFDTAKDYCQRSLALCRPLAEELGTVEARRNLAAICYNLGYLCELTGELSAAKGAYESALVIFEQLAAETDMARSRNDLLICYDQLRLLCDRLGDLEACKLYCTKAMALIGDRSRQGANASDYDLLLDLYLQFTKMTEGEPYFYFMEKSLELCMLLHNKFPGKPRYAPLAAQLRETLAERRTALREEQERQRKQENSLGAKIGRLFRKKKE